jgi:HECT-domain (ubiquitin-transferase)
LTHQLQALRSFSLEEQGAFLRFVTSVSRGPLLGFRYLEPPLCIQVGCAVRCASCAPGCCSGLAPEHVQEAASIKLQHCDAAS